VGGAGPVPTVSGPSIRRLDISPIGRVEGDLDVAVEVAGGVVVSAHAAAALFRGLELILRGKDPQAALVVTPRACGICGASHLYCAAYALDMAFHAEIPPNATLLRSFGQLAESMQSIPRWAYASFFADFSTDRYRDSPHHDELVRRFAPYRGSSYEVGVTLSSRPVAAYAVFAGQWPHSSYMVPGGVMCAPSLSDLTRARALIEQWRAGWLEPVLLGCPVDRYLELSSLDEFETWLEESPAHASSDLGLLWSVGNEPGGIGSYGGGIGRYGSFGSCPEPELYARPSLEGRAASLQFRAGIFADGQWSDFDQGAITEEVAHSFYEGDTPRHPFDGETVPVVPSGAGIAAADLEGKYSWSKAPRYLGRSLELGSSARQVVAARPGAAAFQFHSTLLYDVFDRLGPSALWRAWSRLHEAAVYYRTVIGLLDRVDLNEPFYAKPRERDGDGFGATEAIRGGLAHFVKIRDGLIEQYQIVAPTTFNVGPRDAAGNPGPLEAALIGTPIRDLDQPIEVGQVVRSFDSCLVCTVHCYDQRSHKELARFEIPS
jgi:Ni,Fe-hydrogenase I large subunit